MGVQRGGKNGADKVAIWATNGHCETGDDKISVSEIYAGKGVDAYGTRAASMIILPHCQALKLPVNGW